LFDNEAPALADLSFAGVRMSTEGAGESDEDHSNRSVRRTCAWRGGLRLVHVGIRQIRRHPSLIVHGGIDAFDRADAIARRAGLRSCLS
jgi:hypothetical protein